MHHLSLGLKVSTALFVIAVVELFLMFTIMYFVPKTETNIKKWLDPLTWIFGSSIVLAIIGFIVAMADPS